MATYFPERYTNANETTVAVGGIAAGETFSVESPADVFNRMFYPYIQPTFSAFAITGVTSPLEVGASIAANPTFTFTVTNKANITTAACIRISASSSPTPVTVTWVVPTWAGNNGSYAATYDAVTKLVATSDVFTIQGRDSLSGTFEKTYTVNWYYKRYYGESAVSGEGTLLTDTDIKGMRVSALAASGAGTYAFVENAGKYKWIISAYPLTTFTDTGTGFPASMKTDLDNVDVAVNGVTTSYYIYRSNNILNNAVTIAAS